VITSLELIADGWVLSQSGLLTTKDVLKRAEAYGFRLRSTDLESLYRERLLAPLIAAHDEPQGPPVEWSDPPQHSWDRQQMGLDTAAKEGRLTDPATTNLPDGWRFDERLASDQRGWWNGLVYSRWQLLHLAHLRGKFTMSGQPILRDGKWSPSSEDWARDVAQRSHDLAILLSAIEPRYLPVVDEGWVRLHGASEEEWTSYRDSYDAEAAGRRLSVTGTEVLHFAEQQLLHANSLDPLGPWARLVRHAKPDYQKKLKGLAMLCLDLRTAAEMLLLFAEDLGERLPKGRSTVRQLADDRLSRHGELLEAALQSVGVSPHTRVALIVEGESEVLLVRRILEHLGHGSNPDGLQVIPMRGVTDKERIMKLAGHLATPIITDSYPDSYHTLRPLCRVLIVSDPEPPMDHPDEFKGKLIALIEKGVQDQGINDVDPSSLDWLVDVETWSQALEFEHFTDQEIADAMLQLEPCPLPNGSTLESVTTSVQSTRATRGSLKKVAGRLSKTALADKLWPLLRDQIDAAIHDEVELPPLARVVEEAHLMAIDAMDLNWTLSRNSNESLRPEPDAAPLT